MKIIDVSGYGHSGKTAVTALLSEIDGFYCHDSSFEFNLLRLPDGLIDLKRNLIDNWSLVKSDLAIKRFKKLCRKLNYNGIHELSSFDDSSKKYIDSLVFSSMEINWYDDLYNHRRNNIKDFLRKVLVKTNLLDFYRKFRKPITTLEKDLVLLVNQKSFIHLTKSFLIDILSNNNDVIVTNNAFAPFNPSENFIFFDNCYSVVVDRDPRDIYLSSFPSESLFSPEFEKNNTVYSESFLYGQKQDFLLVDDIDKFIWRQKIIRENTKLNLDEGKIIRIHYEDLIFNYEKTLKILFEKLNIKSKNHINKLLNFDPKISKSNVELWKKCKSNLEIQKIEKELGKYLYKK
jgi:hypothetical protein